MKITNLKFVFACCAPLIAAAQPAAALPKQGSGGRCDCLCEAPGGVTPSGVIHSFATYDSHGQQCDAFAGATCNLTNPNTGGVATGTIKFCDSVSNTSKRPAVILLPSGVKIGPLNQR
jgi:hypothetical protein